MNAAKLAFLFLSQYCLGGWLMTYEQREQLGLAMAHEYAQVTLPIHDAMISCIASAVDAAFAMHNRTNGSTVSLIHGSMADKKLYTVSIYPERTIERWVRPTWQELFDFTRANLDLLLKSGHALGTWFNDRECVHVLDVVVCSPDRDTALALGLRFDQCAIYDLEARREIEIVRSSQLLSPNGTRVANV